jgi:threonine dehydratase
VFEEGGWAEIGRKRLSLDRIKGAGRVIAPVFAGSPQYEVDPLNDEIGLRLVCKVETVNPIGSFKGRGTDYLLYRLKDEHLGRLV